MPCSLGCGDWELHRSKLEQAAAKDESTAESLPRFSRIARFTDVEFGSVPLLSSRPDEACFTAKDGDVGW